MPTQPTPTTQEHPMRRFLDIGLIPMRSIISHENGLLRARSGGSYKITDNETVGQIAASLMSRKAMECDIKDEIDITVTVCVSHPDRDTVGKIVIVLPDHICDQFEQHDRGDIRVQNSNVGI